MAKMSGISAKGSMISPNKPEKAAINPPKARNTSEPRIWRIPMIVTPVGLWILAGAVWPKLIDPHFWQ